MKKMLLATALGLTLALASSAAAQTVNFNRHGFSLWIPDRYRAKVTNNNDRKDFGYSYGTSGYGSINISVQSNREEYSTFQREKGFRNSRWRSNPIDTQRFSVDHYYEGDIAVYRVRENGKTFIKALSMVGLDNKKLVTVEYSAPDIDNGRNHSDIYDIMGSMRCR